MKTKVQSPNQQLDLFAPNHRQLSFDFISSKEVKDTKKKVKRNR